MSLQTIRAMCAQEAVLKASNAVHTDSGVETQVVNPKVSEAGVEDGVVLYNADMYTNARPL